jgi:fatty acid synthase subunit beta
MRSKGLVQLGTAFAGHSLGEFSALAAVADILPNFSLVGIVFYRGLTMQHAVERDEQGHLNYACVPSILAALARHSVMQPS